MPDTEVKWFSNGMPGFHLVLSPQKPLPPEARINRQFIDHQLKLSDKELQTLLADRDGGIATINNLVTKLLPGFHSNTRLTLSTQIADALLDKSLSAQLSREAPTSLDRLQEQDEKLKQIFQQAPSPGAKRGSPPTLLDQVPVGVSLTVYF
jgi:hypothetical protein